MLHNKKGLVFLTSVIFSNVVGIGALTITVVLAKHGAISVLGMLTAAVGCAFAAYALSILSLHVSHKGLEPTWFNLNNYSLGRKLASCASITYILGLVSTNVLIMMSLKNELAVCLSGLHYADLIAKSIVLAGCVLTLWGLTFYRHATLVVSSQIAVLAKFILFGFMILGCLVLATSQSFLEHIAVSKSQNLLGGWLATAIISAYCFSGFESGISLIRSAARTIYIPIAIVLASILAGAFYVGLNAIFLAAVSPSYLASLPLQSVPSILIVKLFGNGSFAPQLCRVLVILAIYGGFNCWCYSGVEIVETLVRDRIIQAKHRNLVSIALVTLSVTIFLMCKSFEAIATFGSMLILLGLCTLNLSSLLVSYNNQRWANLIACALALLFTGASCLKAITTLLGF